jgi:ATP-binding cassette subfamily B protein
MKPNTLPIGAYYRLLRNYLKPLRPLVLLLGFIMLFSIGLQLYNPLLLRSFIDAATTGEDSSYLTRTALLFIGVTITYQLLFVALQYVTQNIGWRATNELRKDITAHCLSLDMSFHKDHTPGEMMERIDGDVNALSQYFSQFIVQFVGSLLLLVGVLVLFFREDYRIGISMTIFVAIAFIALLRIHRTAVPLWKKEREVSAEFYGFLGEKLTGLEDIRANGARAYVLQRFINQLKAWFPIRLNSTMAGAKVWTTTIGVFAFGNATAFLFGYWLWSEKAITVGTVYLLFHYTELLRRPIKMIRTQMQELQKAGALDYCP